MMSDDSTPTDAADIPETEMSEDMANEDALAAGQAALDALMAETH
jgi:hypothetical protein